MKEGVTRGDGSVFTIICCERIDWKMLEGLRECELFASGIQEGKD